MVILDTMVVTVAVPGIGRDLRAGVAELQWVTADCTLVFAGLLLSAWRCWGRWSATGRRSRPGCTRRC